MTTPPSKPARPAPVTPESEPVARQNRDSTEAGAPAKRSAVKLPPGVAPKTGQGPQSRNPWHTGGGAGGRPQTDFARRLGKSRKVH